MIRVGVVGCGYWGKHYLRLFSQLTGSTLAAFCEQDRQRRSDAHEVYPAAGAFADLQEMIRAVELDAVVIATQAEDHFRSTRQAIRAGKHVLAEKPLTLRVEESQELCTLAERQGVNLMVGHTFLFNPAIQALKNLITEGRIGDIYYLTATRTHLGPIRDDTNALWDLAAHDVSIFIYLLDAVPIGVSAVGGSYLSRGREDVVFANLEFPGGVIANIHVSWINANKVRQVTVVGSGGRIVFDDIDHLERLKIFEKGISAQKNVDGFGEFQYLLRDGDIISPRIEMREPLRMQCIEFLDAIRERRPPRSDCQVGLSVVTVLQAIEESLRRGGDSVSITELSAS